ncbi:hypothetical protein EYW49_20550 [Siculibacillus lacustris]|uniref:DNA circulation N-terminal domain-containing protein n=1 Tax=Siculibacillus lacustris TaxID=1549641 RepID=A0A4Q9VF37_9HYPH|nr:DNA circularization N-terminal domain-containing protein [Siculibacillus lacustris]TBW33352.1 hypothetical protein EYW49_20550 [Siculibacillus lacustris]
MTRDWLSTLWPASWQGVPFWVEKDTHAGKRRIASHEFPGRDDPLHEDLGSGVARWQVTAYFASDTADADAAILLAALDQPGPGLLVLPIDGPVAARAHEWHRERERDKAGYVAWQITFLREGATAILATQASLGQSVFDAVDGLSAALGLLATAYDLMGTVDWVTAAVTDGLVDLVAGLDLVAGTILDDAVAALAVTSTLTAVVAAIEDGTDFALASDVVSGFAGLGLDALATGVDAGAVILALARKIGDLAIEADSAAGPDRVRDAFAPWTIADPDAAPVTAATTCRLAMARNGVRLDVVQRLVGLAVTAEAIVRATYASRQEGVAARADFVVATERALVAMDSLGAAEAAEPSTALVAVRDAAVEWLTRAIADLAPVRTIRTSAELPATVLAWVLYRDPSRGPELVSRNQVTHPGFMPRVFEALVS